MGTAAKKETVKLTEKANGLTLTIIEVDGVESLRIDAPLSATPELSKSGRSRVLAGSGGFIYMADGTGVSLNVVEGVKRPRTRS